MYSCFTWKMLNFRLTSITQNSACEGLLSECSFGSEAVPLFVTCLPQLLSCSDFAWNSSSAQIHSSPQSLQKITDKLLFNQASGFGNVLSLLSHLEKSLLPVKQANEASPNGQLYPNNLVAMSSSSTLSQILRAVMDPGLISVDHCDPHLISQAEKDLR